MALCCLFSILSYGQKPLQGKIIDATTREPIEAASIHCASGCSCGCSSNAAGDFTLMPKAGCCKSFTVTSIGYQPFTIAAGQPLSVIQLQQDNSPIQAIVVTANKDAVKRSLAPVAIASISSRMLQDAKPVTADQVLNKVSGVYMVNLGNEQHSMSIRQPMTTRSLFLYLEDGIPIRTTGLYNHNALLEMNMAAVKSMEVIKGPSSSLYGSEAIGGVVNFITVAPTSIPVLKLTMQASNIGYRRTDLQSTMVKGKWGFAVSGYYAEKKNGFIDYSDFSKATITGRVDYRFSGKTSLVNSITLMDYDSDMSGGIDSAKFANKSFTSNYRFTYRKVNALRYRSSLLHKWNNNSKSTASIVYRNNSIGQNPAYGIKDDYRRTANGSWTGKKDLAHGEINEAGFKSYALILQQHQNFKWKQTSLVAGLSADISPSTYSASYIRVHKDSVLKVYDYFTDKDSLLTNYRNKINNYAAFANFEFNPLKKMRVVASLRYDMFQYDFNNYLSPSAYSGSKDTVNRFDRISPKIGLTYNFSNSTGLYANYSEGFVPPQVTEMYKGVKVPELQPSVFYNYEIGGWATIIKGMLSADLSIYKLVGSNEIISVRLDDGSSENRNAGKTLHQGIEAGLYASPTRAINIRFTGALSYHEFTEFVEKGNSYNGNEMNGAPRWMHNAEIWWKPGFAKGLRAGLEWQQLGSYFMDPFNTVKYKGYDVFHLRLGYKWRSLEAWSALMNVANTYYAFTSSKTASNYSYTPAEPRHLTIGISYDAASLFKKK